MGLLEKLLPKKNPTRDEFASLVMKGLAQGGVSNVVYDSAHFILKIDANKTIFLDNGYSNYCKADKTERAQIIFRLCTEWRQSREIPSDYEAVKLCLMPVIRDQMHSHLVEINLRAKNVDVSKIASPTKPLFGPLLVGLAYDTEHSIMQVNQTSFDPWGVTFDDALKQAKDNLRDKTDPNGMREEAAGLYRSLWNDSYDSARILMTDLIYRLNVDGNPVAFVPNRNQLWVTGDRNKAGLIVLLNLGKQAHFEPYPISPELFVLKDGVWEVYVPDDPVIRDLSASLKRHRMALDYKQQKEALDEIHKTQGIDIFVASCLVFERKDKSGYSACVWTNGVESLLPRAEYISFLIDKDAKDFITLPWETAFPIVEDLMKSEPGILPERYKVQSFPDQARLTRLREAASVSN